MRPEFPKAGEKIKFVKPTRSWFINVEEDAKLLTKDEIYTIKKIEIASSA